MRRESFSSSSSIFTVDARKILFSMSAENVQFEAFFSASLVSQVMPVVRRKYVLCFVLYINEKEWDVIKFLENVTPSENYAN